MGGVVGEIWRFPVKSMAGERLERASLGATGIVGDRGWAIRNDATGQIHNAKRFPILLQCAARYRGEPDGATIPPVDIDLPDGSTIGSDSPDCAARLSALIRTAVSLVPLQPATDRAFYRRRIPAVGLVGALSRFRPFRRLLQRTLESDEGFRAELGREPGEQLPDLTALPPVLFECYTPPGTYFDAYPVHLMTTSSLAWMQRLNPAANWDARRFRPNILVSNGVEPDDPIEQRWCGRDLRVGAATVHGELLAPRCAMPSHAQRDLARDPGVLRTIVREANQGFGLYANVARPGTVAVGDPVEEAPAD